MHWTEPQPEKTLIPRSESEEVVQTLALCPSISYSDTSENTDAIAEIRKGD